MASNQLDSVAMNGYSARMDIISLILSLLASDDALRMEEISRATGIASATLRPVMRQLVDAGVVVTSGRTRGTRYMIAVEEISLSQEDMLSYAIGMTAQRITDRSTEQCSSGLLPRVSDTASCCSSRCSVSYAEYLLTSMSSRG